jgi:hypothetical protein
VCSSLARLEIWKNRTGVAKTSRSFNFVQVVNGIRFGIMTFRLKVSVFSEKA